MSSLTKYNTRVTIDEDGMICTTINKKLHCAHGSMFRPVICPYEGCSVETVGTHPSKVWLDENGCIRKFDILLNGKISEYIKTI
jgi:hypothetical protein